MSSASIRSMLILFLFLCCSSLLSFGQDANDDVFAPPYNRVGLTPLLFVNDTINFNYSVKKAFQGIQLPRKFDDNRISKNTLSVLLPTLELPERQEKSESEKEARKREGEQRRNEDETSSLSRQLGQQLVEMSRKKMMSELTKQAFKNLDNPLYDSLMRRYLRRAYVPPTIVDSLYNADGEGRYSMNKLLKRAKYNLTDAQAARLRNTAKGFEGSIKDSKWANKILTSNYILSLHFHDIRRINPDADKTRNNDIEQLFNGYEAMVTATFYRLDLNDSIRAVFYKNCWAGSNSTEEELQQAKKARANMTYPLEKVKTYPFLVTSRQVSSGNSSRKELFYKLPQKAFQQAIRSVEKDVPSFKVRTSIFRSHFSFIANAWAKIGTQEGLTPDNRYFAYEYVAGDSGEVIKKRRGVLRASGDIVNNDTVATGRMQPSRFIQTGGWRLGQGMLLEQKPDWGIGLSGGYMFQGNSFLNVRLDLRISKTFSLPPSWHLYGEYAADLTNFSGFAQGDVTIDNENSKENYDTDVTIRSYGGGISKAFYFLSNFQFVPYIGLRAEEAYFDEDELDDRLGNELEDYDERNWMFDAGARLGINITPWLKISGTFGYSPISLGADEQFFYTKTITNEMASVLDDRTPEDDNPFYLERTPYKWDVTVRLNF